MSNITLAFKKPVGRDQIKNLLINQVEIEIHNYDLNHISDDDAIMVTMVSRNNFKDIKKDKKEVNKPYSLYDINSKKIVEDIYSVLLNIKKGKEKIYSTRLPDFLDLPDVKTFSDIPKSTVDFIRVVIIKSFFLGTKSEEYVDRWNLGSFSLKTSTTKENDILISTIKGIHIPDIVKTQVDTTHEFYLIFSLIRLYENINQGEYELYSGHINHLTNNISNITTKKFLNYELYNLAKLISSPFVILNNKK